MRWLISTIELIGQRLVAPGHDLEPRYPADPVEVDQRYGREGGELDFARLQRTRRRGAVGEDADRRSRREAAAGIPVARVLLQEIVLKIALTVPAKPGRLCSALIPQFGMESGSLLVDRQRLAGPHHPRQIELVVGQLQRPDEAAEPRVISSIGNP